MVTLGQPANQIVGHPIQLADRVSGFDCNLSKADRDPIRRQPHLCGSPPNPVSSLSPSVQSQRRCGGHHADTIQSTRCLCAIDRHTCGCSLNLCKLACHPCEVLPNPVRGVRRTCRLL
jgi:hypothetical protein